MSKRKQERDARRAAEQAEYEASLERAKQATQEQRQRPSAYWPMLGLAGLAIDESKRHESERKAIPPRPDLKD